MGSPEFCYKEMMKNYILLSVGTSKSLRKRFNDDTLKDKSIDELESIIKQFNRNHSSYSHFIAGMATNQFLSEWSESNDMINASFGALGDLMELVGVYDPGGPDFQDTD